MTNSTGADRVARVAGMWRPIEMSDGDIIKLFQSGKHGERNYRQFDGEWYVLDESPEAIAEARQEALVSHLHTENHNLTEEVIFIEQKIDRLTSENERLKRERDSLMHAIIEMDTAQDLETFRKDCDEAMKIVDGIERKRSIPCADLLRPSDADFQQWWNDEGQWMPKHHGTYDVALAACRALASIPRADSPDQIVNANKKVEDPEKCPECKGEGTFPHGITQRHSDFECRKCHGTGLKPKEEKV